MRDHLIAIARDNVGRGALLVGPEHAARIRAEIGAVIGERQFPLDRVMLIGETRLALYTVSAHEANSATIALLAYARGTPRRPLLFADPIAAIAALSWGHAANHRVEGVAVLRSDSIGDLFAAMGRAHEPPRLPAEPATPVPEEQIGPDAWCPRCGDHRLRRPRGGRSLRGRRVGDLRPLCPPRGRPSRVARSPRRHRPGPPGAPLRTGGVDAPRCRPKLSLPPRDLSGHHRILRTPRNA